MCSLLIVSGASKGTEDALEMASHTHMHTHMWLLSFSVISYRITDIHEPGTVPNNNTHSDFTSFFTITENGKCYIIPIYR